MTTRPVALTPSARRHPPPLTLYLHLPWCGRKCPYCDFNSHNAPAALPQTDYLRALTADMTRALPAVWGRPLTAIFIGGGTPSLFSPETIDQLLAQVRALFPCPPPLEITLEANPDSADAKKFTGFRAAGVNRLSLGVQSFNDDTLSRIGRLHNAAAARKAAEAAAGTFDEFNIDLMHALPAQTRAQAEADVDIACGYQPTHLSLYQLTLEPGTPFHRHPPPQLPNHDNTADITDAVTARAIAAGYAQYEVSAYAAPAHRCRHNLNYWQFGDYLGIGAGAHSKLTLPDGVLREQRVKHPGEYMRRATTGDPIAERRQLTPDDIAFEFMLNALRLTEGVPTALLTAHTGGGTPQLRRALSTARERGLLEDNPTHLRPTPTGRQHLNTLTTLFLPT